MILYSGPLIDADVIAARASTVAAQSVRCPLCEARPGYRCTSTGGGNYATVPHHAARRTRIEHWTDAQRVQLGVLVLALRGRPMDAPAGHFNASEAAAAPIASRAAKQPTPKGVRLSEVQAERIEWAAQSGGRTSASTAHFDGDAAERQTVNSLVAKGILVEGELIADGYERRYYLTVFGWQVYRRHRLIIRRLSDEEIEAGEASSVARESEPTN